MAPTARKQEFKIRRADRKKIPLFNDILNLKLHIGVRLKKTFVHFADLDQGMHSISWMKQKCGLCYVTTPHCPQMHAGSSSLGLTLGKGY